MNGRGSTHTAPAKYVLHCQLKMDKEDQQQKTWKKSIMTENINKGSKERKKERKEGRKEGRKKERTKESK